MQMRRQGFTLVELLIVITIIGLLAGLSFPAYQMAMVSAQKARALALATNVKTGLTAYNTEYGTWPYDSGSGGGTGPSTTTLQPTNAYKLLIGDPDKELTGTTYANNRQIVFTEFPAKDLDNSQKPTKFVTPWKIGGVFTDYSIAVDGNGTNQLDNIPDCNNPGGSGTITLNAGCAVWCSGPPDKGAANTDTTKFVRTW